MLEEIAAGPPPAGRTLRLGPSGCALGHTGANGLSCFRRRRSARRGSAGRSTRIAWSCCQRVRPARLRPPRRRSRVAVARRTRRGAARLASGPARRQCALPRRGPLADRRRRGRPHRQPFHGGQATSAAYRGLRAGARSRADFRRPRDRRRPSRRVGGGAPCRHDARLGVDGVFLAGWYDHVEVPAFLSAADVFALASVREQFGLVLVEAMACGVPPVAVDRFGPGEIVADGETGRLVEPDDVDGLAAALLEAIEDPAERARRGIRGQPSRSSAMAGPRSPGASPTCSTGPLATRFEKARSRGRFPSLPRRARRREKAETGLGSAAAADLFPVFPPR